MIISSSRTHASKMKAIKFWYCLVIRGKMVRPTILTTCIIIIFNIGGIYIVSRFREPIDIVIPVKWTDTDDVNRYSLETGTKSKVILFWTKYYGSPSWLVKAGKEKCGRYTCFLTYNKSHYDKASALVFHHRTDWLLRLPTDRPRIPWQRWVLYNRESSWWGPKGAELSKANDLINWTMGLRGDNDITIPTAKIWKGQFKEGFDPYKNYLEGKTGKVVALMSDCMYHPLPTGYKSRKKYLEFLTKHGLKIDMYGKCGKSCGETFSSCAETLKKFKFVLAFENSICDEYISEKPYRNGLQLGVVPVVMSGANLSDPYVLPPGSFIDAGQFSSVTALVAFLEKVGSDPQLYNKYFEWRRDWDFQLISENEGQEDFSNNYFCPLCTRLHESHPPKSIENLRAWFEREKCRPYPTVDP